MKKRTLLLTILFLLSLLTPAVLRADDDDDDGDQEWYGLIESRPNGTAGTWVIGGLSFTATNSTRLEMEHGPLVVGACAEVEYLNDSQSTAVEIESDDSPGCRDDDGDDDDHHENENKIYATLNSFPSAPYVGIWTIGGLPFEATAATEFEQEHGAFAVGACIEAEYYLNGASRILHEVETENSYKCSQNNGGGSYSTSYGTIEQLPATPNLAGSWRVSGVNYTVDAATRLKTEHGPFVVGAYVEVEYDNNFRAIEIETHVAPQTSTNLRVGILDAHDASDDWNDWVVDGTVYQADPIIDVGIGSQAPVVGELVLLNSYQDAGTDYATAVRRATQIFLPTVQR